MADETIPSCVYVHVKEENLIDPDEVGHGLVKQEELAPVEESMIFIKEELYNSKKRLTTQNQ